MSSQTPTPPPGPAPCPTHLLTALVAFTCGMAAMWLIIHARPAAQAPGAPGQPGQPRQAAALTLQPEAAKPPQPQPPQPEHQTAQTVAEAVQAGHDFYDERRWVDAINRYEYAIANGGDHPDIRTNLGNCFRFIGQPEKALEQYDIAQRQNPRHEFSLFNTATLYIEVLNDLPRAVDTWRLYEARFPGSIQSERVRRFLSQNPRFAAALEATPEATPPATPSPAPATPGPSAPTAPTTPTATPAPSASSGTPPANPELLEWMKQEAPLPPQ